MAGGLRQAWARSAPRPGATAGPPGLTPRDHRQIRKGRRRRAPKFPWSCHFLPPRLWVQRPERQRATTGVAGSVETCALHKGCSATAATPGTHARPRRARTGACGMPPCGREAKARRGASRSRGCAPRRPRQASLRSTTAVAAEGFRPPHHEGGRCHVTARPDTMAGLEGCSRAGHTELPRARTRPPEAQAARSARGPPGSRRQHPRAALRLRCSAAPLPCRTGAGPLCSATVTPLRRSLAWSPAGARRVHAGEVLATGPRSRQAASACPRLPHRSP